MPVIQNEPILPMKLASKEAGAGLPPAIPPGLRAVSVRVNEVIGVAGYVLPGTRVDVRRHREPDPGSQRHDLEGHPDQRAGARRRHEDRADVEREKPIAVNVVTLLVNPEEAERLTLASTEGKIQLALRNPLDKATPVTRGVKPAGAARRAARPTPARATARPRRPRPPWPVGAAADLADRRNHSR